MIKKITALLMLFVLVMSFSGCMQITYHITLNSNGTADCEYEMQMDKSTVSMIMGTDGENADPFSENRANAEAKGFVVTPVETENQEEVILNALDDLKAFYKNSLRETFEGTNFKLKVSTAKKSGKSLE